MANNTTAGLVQSEKLAVANTAIEDAASRLFAMGVPGVHQQFTTMRQVTGTKAELDVVDGLSPFREWLGSKTFKKLKAFNTTADLRSWEASFTMPVTAVAAGGAVNTVISAFSSAATRYYETIMITNGLLSNLTCYDGQALLSASHPLSSSLSSTTYDNLESAALTAALFNTAWEAMRSRTDFAGNYIDVTPSHLLVGPNLSKEAMEITGSTFPVGITDGGEIVQPGGSAVDANAVLIENYRGGPVEVIVTPYITGNEWFLMDLTKGDIKPMYGFEFERPSLTIKDAADDDNVFYHDRIDYSFMGRLSPLAGMPQLIHGSVTA